MAIGVRAREEVHFFFVGTARGLHSKLNTVNRMALQNCRENGEKNTHIIIKIDLECYLSQSNPHNGSIEMGKDLEERRKDWIEEPEVKGSP